MNLLKRLVTNSIKAYKQRRELDKEGYGEREKQSGKRKTRVVERRGKEAQREEPRERFNRRKSSIW